MPAVRLRNLRPRPEPYEGHAKAERSPSPIPELPTLAAALDLKPDLAKKGKAPTKAKTITKVKGAGEGEGEGGGGGGGESTTKGKGAYDRALLVTLVAKASKAGYGALAESVDKTANQCRDIWRKVVFPALVDGREWSAGVRGWDGAMKLHLAREVLGTAKPDWEAVAASFPGHTPTQVSDVWRKVVLPRIMSGKPLY